MREPAVAIADPCSECGGPSAVDARDARGHMIATPVLVRERCPTCGLVERRYCGPCLAARLRPDGFVRIDFHRCPT